MQPRDRAIPGPNLPNGRRVPPVELSAQRRNLGVALVRGPADGLAQPGDVLLQPIDLVAMPGLEPLDFVVAPSQPEAVIGPIQEKWRRPTRFALLLPRI